MANSPCRFVAVARAIATEVEDAGGEVRLGAGVVGLRRQGDGAVVTVEGDPSQVRLDHVVVAAGLQADRVAALVARSA